MNDGRNGPQGRTAIIDPGAGKPMQDAVPESARMPIPPDDVIAIEQVHDLVDAPIIDDAPVEYAGDQCGYKHKENERTAFYTHAAFYRNGAAKIPADRSHCFIDRVIQRPSRSQFATGLRADIFIYRTKAGLRGLHVELTAGGLTRLSLDPFRAQSGAEVGHETQVESHAACREPRSK